MNPQLIASLVTDPLKFVAFCWPHMSLSDKQTEVLLSVDQNIETFVHACNKAGKTRVAALVALWFFISRTPARVVVSSATEAQLSSILWREILELVATSRFQLPLDIKHLRIEKLAGADGRRTENLDYILGSVTTKPESFQGHHLDSRRPRVLVVFDEASGIDDAFYEAAGSWAHRMLVIGNPLSTSNFFFRCCRQGDQPDAAGQALLQRKVIHIDGRDSPNVRIGLQLKEQGFDEKPPVLIPGILTYEEYVRHASQWDEAQRTMRLHGQFYEGAGARLFPAQLLDRAERAWHTCDHASRRAEAMGVDVAAGGRDKTCWTVVDHLGVIDQYVEDTPNTMSIVGRTIQLIQDHGIPPDRVVFDAGGGGKQLADRLAEQDVNVATVYFGEAAEDRQAYRLRRSELYGHLRELLRGDGEQGVFALPPDSQLREELAVLPDDRDSEGRLVLPPKNQTARGSSEKSIRQLLGRSPDRADSLVLAAWGLRQPVYSDFVPGVLACSGGPDDNLPFTEAELQNCPPETRALLEYLEQRYGRTGDGQQPNWVQNAFPYDSQWD